MSKTTILDIIRHIESLQNRKSPDAARQGKGRKGIGDEQFKSAAKACDEAGLSIGLYQDLLSRADMDRMQELRDRLLTLRSDLRAVQSVP